ncbi:dipeptide epimerase [uncultured Rubinisphaera sp.]|uniref:dipeptide epimerase n=1 Tax=uncultured Rubinisphaera sp. TaxID=1678686 RepID=UPI0030D7E34B|tara:strand:- start:1509 stop:2537 length:1029 start_codon:yes stop_codon:yes gene_type:complete
MKLLIHTLDLPLKIPFTISRGSFSVQKTVIVELHQAGHIGYGEATQHAYYQHSQESIVASLEKVRPFLESCHLESPEELWQELSHRLNGDTFALSALDQAAHDLAGKITQRSVYEQQGLAWQNIPASSVTLSISSIPQMIEQLSLYQNWPVIKIKLGTDNDLAIVEILRDHTNAIFRVDANCAWTVSQTIQLSERFKELGVEFIEQPLPAHSPDKDHETVFRESALPIIADESCVLEEDVVHCSRHFHGINIKLCKCGGLTPAFRMLKKAKELSLLTMAGCMIESNVAISAAAQLLPLLDYADLDGEVLLAENPATGVELKEGHFSPSTEFGCGTRLAEQIV